MNSHKPLLILSMLMLFFFVCALSFAQEQTTRLLKQHRLDFIQEHLSQTEIMLVQSLRSDNLDLSSSAAQTIRELEEIFPSESLSSFISPLRDILRDENADTQLRIISALALDKLHSDDGDQVIYEVAKNTSNETIKNICEALAIKSFKAEEKLSSK